MKTTLKDIFFPPRCCGCDKLTSRDFPLCEDCSKLIIHPSEKRNRCDICFLSEENCLCRKFQYYEKLCIPLHYEGDTKRVIFKLKFRSRPDIAENFAKLIYYALNERCMTKSIDVITFVPMRKFAKFLRGYNQAELIAKHLSSLACIPCHPLVYKTEKTENQHSLSKTERTGNLLGIFEPLKESISLIEGKRILIVDDVFTTGSTLNEIAKTLLIFGAESVSIAVCAATKNSHKKH